MRVLKSPRLLAGDRASSLAIVAVALWPESMAVDVATVARGPLQVTIDEEGETRVRDRFVVSAPVAGRCRIELEPGDAVRRGVDRAGAAARRTRRRCSTRARARELSAAVEAARAAVGQAQAEREPRRGQPGARATALRAPGVAGGGRR